MLYSPVALLGQGFVVGTLARSCTGGLPCITHNVIFLRRLGPVLDVTTKRTGWVIRGVPAPESIADHMYRMGMMSLVASGSELDQARCVKMSIVHDVAEAIVGDITPHCKVSPEEKKRLEADAVAQIQSMLGPDTRAAQEVSELWREYEAAASPEAQFVKDMDKIEMILQAYEYEGLQQGLNLQEFYDGTTGRFKTEAGKALAAEVLARRQVRRASAVEGPGPAASSGPAAASGL
ncbi:HD domain-containing protein [Haematococcus lacustris]|uniref:5'-deoxynucleotidase n=1 Tax=Haematococcus lacustris TaxID=44745 RepID=A0A699YUJ4_HAELA|nr:HD domain-containing protein [Haematococcus lacustris]